MDCESCAKPVYKIRFVGDKWLGVDCGCAGAARMRSSVVNPYSDLTLEHVHGEDGKPVRVTSSRQLSEAEQRYNFASVVRNMNEGNFDSPPQQKVFKVSDVYRERFARR